jgi:hypothetical protein
VKTNGKKNLTEIESCCLPADDSVKSGRSLPTSTEEDGSTLLICIKKAQGSKPGWDTDYPD